MQYHLFTNNNALQHTITMTASCIAMVHGSNNSPNHSTIPNHRSNDNLSLEEIDGVSSMDGCCDDSSSISSFCCGGGMINPLRFFSTFLKKAASCLSFRACIIVMSDLALCKAMNMLLDACKRTSSDECELS